MKYISTRHNIGVAFEPPIVSMEELAVGRRWMLQSTHISNGTLVAVWCIGT